MVERRLSGTAKAAEPTTLDDITAGNVGGLQLAWAWAMTEGGWNEPAPVVRDGVMYLNNMGNIVQALDAARHGPRAEAGRARNARVPVFVSSLSPRT